MKSDKKIEKRDRHLFQKRAEELVKKMTVEQAASQLLHSSPAIPELGIPAYNWWNEALHGVAFAGVATVFPQAIGLAAMFDKKFLYKIAEAVSDEARAKHRAALEYGDREIFKGLTFWSPNVNIFRDPRWGRGQETYGEDPYLTSELGVAFIRGLQGCGEVLKTAACAKHFAAHSGPEGKRHSFNAEVSAKDLEETYLPAFEAAVKEGKVEAVMGAYSALNGEPCCANTFLLQEKLRKEWGFEGHVVSDCGAIADIASGHRTVASGTEAAALALGKGCDLNCGCAYENLSEALRRNLIGEEQIRQACVRLFTTRFALGMFDKSTEYDNIPYRKVACAEHKKLALRAAERSFVLLKNDGLLPLQKKKLRAIAVIGPNADSQSALYGNYNGDSDDFVTDLQGIRAGAGTKIRIFHSKGSHLYKTSDPSFNHGNLFGEAVKAAKESDVAILCVGYDGTLEGEETGANNSFLAGDRADLLLPLSQRELIEEVLKTGTPTVLVLHSGSGIDVSMYEDRVSAILQVWYSGERGGEALSDLLFGKVSPSGRLPVTVYYNSQPLPGIEDYSMQGRTYRFLRDEPLYPFGYGLSYVRFAYSQLCAEAAAQGKELSGSVVVSNLGEMAAEEVVEAYIRYEGESFEKPNFSLCFFCRQKIGAGEKKRVQFRVRQRSFETVAEDGTRSVKDGEYSLFIGGNAPDARSVALSGNRPLMIKIYVKNGRILSVFSQN